MQVLHVIGSPKGSKSTSTQIATAFLDAYITANPAATVTTLDVWDTSLPAFDGAMAHAKLAPLLGEEVTQEQAAAWQRVTKVIDEFAEHDKIVISTPMWNFGLPYELKHYIDLLVQPGITFGLDSDFNHVGLLVDRRVQLVLTRSSPLPEGSPEDFQLPYLQHILGFMGLSDVRTMLVEGTTLAEPARTEFIDEHCRQARLAAADF